jgi:hypothetical protein
MIYVRVCKPATQQDPNRSAKLEEVSGIVRVKQELVLIDAIVDWDLFIYHRGRDLRRGAEGTLFAFKDPFNSL